MTGYSIGILGAGSVGLGVAASLVKAGAQVTLLARGKTLQALRAGGIHVTGVVGEHAISPRDFSVADVGDLDPPALACDAVIVTTKTYEVMPALKALLPALKAARPAFLLLQNGWGSADEAKKILPMGTALFSGSVMTGLERLTPTEVRINAHVDAVQVGSLFGDDIGIIQPLLDVSQRGFLAFAPAANIEATLLTKLLYNICLNPLGALLSRTYGELLGNEETLGEMEHLAGEGIRVLKAVHKFDLFASGKDYVRGVLVAKLMSKVKAHRSSMLQDIETGRPTEIDYLNGAITAMGRKAGIGTPYNDVIIARIRDAEERKFA